MAERLSAAQVSAAGLEDWRQILGRLKARYRTGDFATGLALVDAIGEAAAAADHHPDLQLSYTDVVVTLASHDVGGISQRDIDLARRISQLAQERRVTADPGGLTQLELGLDTSHAQALGPFYAALLGSELRQGEPVDPTGQVPTVWWQDPHASNGTPLPGQPFEQRWHFDVWVGADEAERRVQAVLDAGGRLISDQEAPAYWVLEDADGNRHCICTPAGR